MVLSYILVARVHTNNKYSSINIHESEIKKFILRVKLWDWPIQLHKFLKTLSWFRNGSPKCSYSNKTPNLLQKINWVMGRSRTKGNVKLDRSWKRNSKEVWELWNHYNINVIPSLSSQVLLELFFPHSSSFIYTNKGLVKHASTKLKILLSMQAYIDIYLSTYLATTEKHFCTRWKDALSEKTLWGVNVDM